MLMDKSHANIYLAGKNKENTLVFFPTPRAMAILALGLYPPLGSLSMNWHTNVFFCQSLGNSLETSYKLHKIEKKCFLLLL